MSFQKLCWSKISGNTVLTELTVVAGDQVRIKSDGLPEAINGAHASEGTPVNAAAAAVVLVVGDQPTAGMNLVIGTKTYTFVASGQADLDGEISVGADEAAAKLNIVAAINGTDEVNEPHPDVSAAAFSGDNCTITALVKGAAGNAIASTDTLTGGSNGFAAATLLLGVDGTLATEGKIMRDATYLYVAVADNTTAGQNWRRMALGSAY